jgi:hypothetical protein
MTWLASVGTLLLIALAAPVQAQTVDSPDLTIEAEIGLDGWVDTWAPTPLRLQLTSRLFFNGTVHIDLNGAPVDLAVEVPAGSEKSYQIWLSPQTASHRFDLEVYPAGSSEPVEVLTINPRAADQVILVGTLDLPAEPRLPEFSRVGDQPIELVDLEGPEVDPGPLDYLLAVGELTLSEHHLAWLNRGGSLIVERSQLPELGVPGLIPTGAVDRFRVGRGEVLAMPDLDLAPGQWEALLRFRPSAIRFDDPWTSSEPQLLQAAGQSQGGVRLRPSLLIGLGVYALVVAPVNLIILHRIRRRELAWITVPAISLMATLGFWLIGVFNTPDTNLAHATVISGGESRAYSTVVLAAESEGSHEVSVPDPTVLYPGPTLAVLGIGGETGRRTVLSPHRIEVSFEDAGYSTVNLIESAPPLPTVTFELAGGEARARVVNHSPFQLLAYAVTIGGMTAAAPEPLGTGQSATVQFDPNVGMAPFETLAQRISGGALDRLWGVFQPLSIVAGQVGGPDYFFAFVDLGVEIDLDGRPREVRGPGVIVIPMVGADLGSASPEVMEVGEDGFLWEGGAWFEGTSVVLRYLTPPGKDPTLVAGQLMWGGFPTYAAWDWSSDDFIEVEPGLLDRRFISADGEILVRVFDSSPFSLLVSSLRVVWEAGS